MDGLAKKIKVLVICGATATGKTELAFSLCECFGAELIGADSMQLYQGLPIGTAAPLLQDSPQVPRHLISFLPGEQGFSVADYLQMANDCIRDVAARESLPLVCGGTGLYVDALVNGVRFSENKLDEALLVELGEAWERDGGEALLRKLSVLDPNCAEKLHKNDKKRIVRALAEAKQNGNTLEQRNAASRKKENDFEFFVIVLAGEDRARLYHSIEQRVDKMLQKGLLQEAQWVYENRARFKTAVQAIAYKEFFPYFAGEKELSACVQALKQATRRYAKRQLTWFRNHGYDLWIAEEATEARRQAEEAVKRFLSS